MSVSSKDRYLSYDQMLECVVKEMKRDNPNLNLIREYVYLYDLNKLLFEFVVKEMKRDNPDFDLIKKFIRHPDFSPVISRSNYYSESPLTIACQNDWTELVDLMIENQGSKIQLYHYFTGYYNFIVSTIVLKDSVGVLKLLVEKMNLDVNHKIHDDDYNNGNTLLLIAVINRSTKCIEYLLSLPQTNVNIQNTWRKTALMTCAELGYADIMKLLLAHKDIEIDKQIVPYYFGAKTVFHLACQKFNVECVKLLRDYESTKTKTDYKELIRSCMNAIKFRNKKTSDEDVIETFKIIFELPIRERHLDILWYNKRMIDIMRDDPLSRLVRNFLMYHGMKSDKLAPLNEDQIAEVRKRFYPDINFQNQNNSLIEIIKLVYCMI